MNLASRRARDQGSNPVRAEAALTGLRAATETRFWGGRGGLVASARRSWWDWATNAVAAPDGVPGPDEVVDYALVSWSGVFDYSWGEHNHVEVSTLFEEDQLDGGIPGGIYGNFGRWGNKADRVSLDTRVANVPVRFAFGESRYRADIWDDPSPSPPRNPLDEDVVTLDPAMGRLGYTFLRGELVGEREGGRPARWTVGLEITEQFSRQSGAALPPHAVGEARRILEGQQLQYGVLFADYRLEPRPDLTIQAGVRWETGSQVVNGGQDRMAPRLSLRFRVNPRVSISAAYGRSYQYAQPIGEAGKPFGQQWHYAHTWLLAGTQSPVLRSDVGTLGVERWLGGTWLASTTGYIRHATGVAMEDPRPGSVFPVGWPGVEPRSAWVEGTNTAFGLEMGIRRLAGRVTGSAAYSLGVSNFKGGQLDFASPADRRHVLDATLMTRAQDNLLLGAAFTAASGAPFTRTFNDYCHDWPDASGNCPAPATGPIPFRGPPNAERGPTYDSLDLLVDWTSERLGWSWGAYLQLRNVLGRDNKGVFIETTCSADSYIGGGCSSPELQRDSFEGGISFPLPLIGFRLAF